MLLAMGMYSLYGLPDGEFLLRTGPDTFYILNSTGEPITRNAENLVIEARLSLADKDAYWKAVAPPLPPR